MARFSATVMRVNTCRPSGTCASPMLTILLGSILRRSCPSYSTDPVLIGTRPVTAWSVVVLPAPFAPMRETISPSSTSMEMPRSACTAP